MEKKPMSKCFLIVIIGAIVTGIMYFIFGKKKAE